LEELHGRNALVTGAAGGLGGYIARALAAEGVNLALSDLPGKDMEILAAELSGRGVTAQVLPADLTRGSGRGTLIASAEEALGPLDVLVNNAGLEFGGDFTRTTDEEMEAIVDVNLLALMALTRDVLHGMLERRRGHVINVASVAGRVTPPFLATYVATKHGVVGFTHSLRAEYAGSGVGFSAICPGMIGRVGMYGRVRETLGRPPWPASTSPPESVGKAVVKGIRDDRPELIVNRPGAKLLALLSTLAPGVAVRLANHKPYRTYAERYAAARGRH
jgi:short-subunit dehydrogenase